MLGDVDGMMVSGEGEPIAWTREVRRVDEAVVLEEADEDTGKDPGHSRLGQVVFSPDVVGLGGAACRSSPFVLPAYRSVDLGIGVAALAKIILQGLQQPLEIRE